jgi:hypothetical protein
MSKVTPKAHYVSSSLLFGALFVETMLSVAGYCKQRNQQINHRYLQKHFELQELCREKFPFLFLSSPSRKEFDYLQEKEISNAKELIKSLYKKIEGEYEPLKSIQSKWRKNKNPKLTEHQKAKLQKIYTLLTIREQLDILKRLLKSAVNKLSSKQYQEKKEQLLETVSYKSISDLRLQDITSIPHELLEECFYKTIIENYLTILKEKISLYKFLMSDPKKIKKSNYKASKAYALIERSRTYQHINLIDEILYSDNITTKAELHILLNRIGLRGCLREKIGVDRSRHLIFDPVAYTKHLHH